MLHGIGPAEGEAMVAVSEAADPVRLASLASAGAKILIFPPSPDGRVPLEALLRRLCQEGVNNVLCEGGGEIAAALALSGLADEIWAFVAPKLIGGSTARGPLGGSGLPRLTDALDLEIREIRRIGEDLLIRANPKAEREA